MKEEGRWKTNVKRLLQSKIFWFFVIIFVVVSLVRTIVTEQVQVGGTSMEPTFQDGNILMIDKLSNRSENPRRYEVIVFEKEDGGKVKEYVKRVIGLPRETVQIRKGKIYINGRELEEPYEFDAISDGGVAREKIELGEDEYFVLGDNRNNSKDSRNVEIGIVKREQIKGKVYIRLYPYSKVETYEIEEGAGE